MPQATQMSENFKENGYAVIKGFFREETVTGYQQFLTEVIKEKVAPVFAKWNIDVYGQNIVDQVKDVLDTKAEQVSFEEKQILLGHFPLQTRLSEKIYPVASELGKSQILRNIFNSEHLFLHMPPMIRFVPPAYIHAAVPPHQDINYNTHMSNFITVWTPFVEIDDKCGGVVVYEGSQHLESDGVQPTGTFEGWLPPADTSAYKKHQITGMKPGDALLLSTKILHESAANISERFRLSADFRVFSHHDRTTKHCLDLKTMQVMEPQFA